MKQFYLILALFLTTWAGAQAQVVETIALTEAGTLEARLGDKISTVTKLILSGPINEADFTVMREKVILLQELDFKEVTLPTAQKQAATPVIPREALQGKRTLKKVILPKAVVEILDRSFYNCTNLKEVDFSNCASLKNIQYDAFGNCNSLSKLDFTKCSSLESVSCFSNNTGLQSVDFSKCVKLQKIQTSAFSACYSLQSVKLTGCSALETIENGAFYDCGQLSTIDLTNCSALTSIGERAFHGCGQLSQFNVNGCTNLISIEDNAFGSCRSLKSFDFEKLSALQTIGNNAFSTSSYSPNETDGLAGEIRFGTKVTTIGENAFYGCSGITKLSFAGCASLSIISESAFGSCRSLITLDFTGCTALNSLSNNIVQDCPSLQEIKMDNNYYTSVNGVLFIKDKSELLLYPQGKKEATYTIPSTVTIIGESAFMGTQLTSLEIPAGITNIKPDAFSSFRLETVIMKSSMPIQLTQSIGLERVFVNVPTGASGAYKKARFWSDYIIVEDGQDKLTVAVNSGNSLEGKIQEAGYRSEQIKELTVTGSLNASDFEFMKNRLAYLITLNLSGASLEGNSFPGSVFSNRVSLKTVVLPNSITSIGYEAFSNCNHLSQINMPSSIERIGGRAFSNTSLTTLDLSACANLSNIGYNAFSGCAISGVLLFPASLQAIESNAFDAAKGITSIKIRNQDVVSLGTDAFKLVNKENTPLNVPKGMKQQYSTAENWKEFKQIQEYGNLISVTSNNTEYGTVSGGGAFEKGETVTLGATSKPYWPGDQAEYAFEGWYEGEKLLSKEKKYSFKHEGGQDRIIQGRFALPARIEYNPKDRITLTGEIVVGNKITLIAGSSKEGEAFWGWYEIVNNGEYKLITVERALTITVENGYKNYEASFHPNYWVLQNSYYEIGDDRKITDKTSLVLYGSSAKITGVKTLDLSNLSLYLDRKGSSFLTESPVATDAVSVILEEYNSSWYFLCFPVDVAMNEIKIENGEGWQFVVREYDGAARAGKGMGESWKQLKNDATLKANKGYIFKKNGYFRCSFEPSNPAPFISKDDKTVPLSSYTSTKPVNANWNLVGNPYPCYYKTAQLFTNGLDAPIVVWNPELNNYESYTQDDEDVLLDPLSSFFVQKDKATVLKFTSNGRSAGPLADVPEVNPGIQTKYASARTAADRSIINLILSCDSLSDKTRVVFNEKATLGYDLGKDVSKFMSLVESVPQIYSLDNENNYLSINERPKDKGVVKLGIRFGSNATYQIKLKENVVGGAVYLKDLTTGIVHDLSKGTYTFTATVGSDNERFELQNGVATSNDLIESGICLHVMDGLLRIDGLSANDEVTVINGLGQLMERRKALDAHVSIRLANNGIYFVSITHAGRTFTQSIKW